MTTFVLDADGTSTPTPDYTNLETAIETEATDLVTATIEHRFQIRNAGSTVYLDITDVAAGGYTTSSTYPLIIEAYTGYEATPDWDSTKVYIRQNGTTNWHAFNLSSVAYTEFHNIQFAYGPSGDTDGLISFNTGEIHFENCYFHSLNTGTPTNLGHGIRRTGNNSITFIMVNSVVANLKGYPMEGFWWTGGAQGGVIYNNTIIDNGAYGIYLAESAANNNIKIKNNIVSGHATADYDLTNPDTTATNYSGDSTSPDGASYQGSTPTFVDAANDDYHLASGDDGSFEGTDLSSDADYAFSTDMEGVTRVDWDAGVDEYIAAATGNPWYYYAQL